MGLFNSVWSYLLNVLCATYARLDITNNRLTHNMKEAKDKVLISVGHRKQDQTLLVNI